MIVSQLSLVTMPWTLSGHEATEADLLKTQQAVTHNESISRVFWQFSAGMPYKSFSYVYDEKQVSSLIRC